MFGTTKKYDEDIPKGHAMQERRRLHSRDIELRERGFRIHSRKGNQEPLWERGGKVFTESAALKVSAAT